MALVILDGWGHSPVREGNAIALAKTPFYDHINQIYPRTLLEAAGKRVGLPAGAIGNSEVGHMNIGAGRPMRTDVVRIDEAIESGEFFNNSALVAAVEGAKKRGARLHLMGLVSDGLVHSSQQHLYALLRLAKQRAMLDVFIHCFLDGRDVPPRSARRYITDLEQKIRETGCGQIATLIGRYYAMDRDRRWERTLRAYNLLVHGEGERAAGPIEAIERSYNRGVTDEFIEPVVITEESGEPVASFRDGDAVIFFNFRADRARQITMAIALPGFDAFPVPDRPRIDFVCFTQYDKTFPLAVAFPPERPRNTLAELLGSAGIRNLRIAETEKYAHITYFFNCGVEEAYPHERRLLVPSPKVPTYDLQPEMSAYRIMAEVLRAIDQNQADLYVINFANPDMVGHTGRLDKAIEAVQHIDLCLELIVKRIRQSGGACLIVGDHGNCEQMIDYRTGQPHTAHTTNPVPFHLVDDDLREDKLRDGGALEDVAPTILALLGISKPAEMTGRDLRKR